MGVVLNRFTEICLSTGGRHFTLPLPSFHNLFYEVMVGAGCCKKAPKEIIKDVRLGL